ncbi:MAG: type II secretion system minor pseudopilin GspK [Nitrospiraceae bacterium]|nr:type II secretion system minor pseudopilin GspK [Nitrospiraceae bacterium]
MKKEGSRLRSYASPLLNEGGIALVLTLMIVALITAMVVEFAYGVYVNTTALHNWQTSQGLSVEARSATKLAAKLISERGRDFYTGDVFEISQKVPFGDLDSTITLRIEDENGKFNLNQLAGISLNPDQDPNKMFVRLVRALGLKDEVADRISDWIDSDHEPRVGDSENGAKNAALDSIDELLLIPGIDMQTYQKLLPYVTIYTDKSAFQININSADVPVLMSLSDSIDRDLAERIVRYRTGEPFRRVQDIKNVLGVSDQLPIALQGLATTQGTAFHVIAAAEAGGVKRVVESVLYGNAVLYWKEM